MGRNFEGCKIGQKITAKDLVGLNYFNIMFSPTIGYDVNGKVGTHKWDNGKESITYVYGNGQHNSMSIEQELIVIDHNSVAHEENVFRFLGRNWREEYKAD